MVNTPELLFRLLSILKMKILVSGCHWISIFH